MPDAINTNQAEAEAALITDEFGFFDDWEDRYQMVIDQGRRLAPCLTDIGLTPIGYVVASQLCILLPRRAQTVQPEVFAESTRRLCKGYVALLLRVYSGRSVPEILATDPDFFAENWA